MNLQAKDTKDGRQPPEAGRGAWDGYSLRASRKNACQQLDFTLLASRAVRQHTYVVLSLQFCGNFLRQSQDWFAILQNDLEREDREGTSFRQEDVSAVHTWGVNAPHQAVVVGMDGADRNLHSSFHVWPIISFLCIYTHSQRLIYWTLIVCQVRHALHSLFNSHNKNTLEMMIIPILWVRILRFREVK